VPKRRRVEKNLPDMLPNLIKGKEMFLTCSSSLLNGVNEDDEAYLELEGIS
jgi:hypothetical protein